MLAITIAFLPYLCLLGCILYFIIAPGTRGAPLFANVTLGAVVWSLAVWGATNFFSGMDWVDGAHIETFWVVATFILACLLIANAKGARLHFAAIERDAWPLAAAIAFTAFATFVICLSYPPANWDVMSYHLPRVEQWLQNHNLAPFPTSTVRQIGMPPFNSMIMLQAIAPDQVDYFVNLGQWLALIGSLMGVYRITIQLGGHERAAWLAAFFLGTLPSAMQQAVNAESCNIVTFYVLGCASALLAWRQNPSFDKMLIFGLCLGFATLSKGSAYPILLPFVLLVAWQCLRHPRQLFLQGMAAALIMLAINMPHWLRAYAAYGSFVGGTETNILYHPTLGTFITNIFYNFFCHEPWLLTGPLQSFWIELTTFLGVDQADKAVFPFGGLSRGLTYFNLGDGYGQNPIHAFFLLVLLAAYALRKLKTPPMYSLATLASFCIYCLVLTWHPWTGRIHTTLFALAAPLCGLFLNLWPKTGWLNGAATFMLCNAMFPIFFSYTWFFPPNTDAWPGSEKRETFYPVGYERIRFDFMDAIEYLAAQKPRSVGLRMYIDAFEYPVWAILYRRLGEMPKIMHMTPDNKGYKPDYIWVQEKGTDGLVLGRPYILKRQGDDYVKVFPANSSNKGKADEQ